MVVYKVTDLKVYSDDGRLMGYILDYHSRDEPKWQLFDRDMTLLYEGKSIEDCQENIQLLIDYWEENKDDY